MRAFITGVTGFIGSHVAELLISNGCQVLGVGQSGRWRDDAPTLLTDNVELLPWNIEQPANEALHQRVAAFSPTVVFHFAGMSIPGDCGTDVPTTKAMSVNVQGTHHVLDLAEQLSPLSKFIFASTVHVYARINRDSPVVKETAKIDPISAYGMTKRECELEILRRTEAGPLKACIVRGFHHIGPRQPQGLMLTDWLGQLADPNCTELLVRSTNSYLDLVDVCDAALAYQLLAENQKTTGIFNLGSGRISNSGEVLRAILELTGRSVKIKEGSSDERWNAIANVEKLQAMGWNAERDYSQTIRSMISYDRERRS